MKVLHEEDGGLFYATDENGMLVSEEIIRDALERSGFDGVIDNTVDKKFGSQKRVGTAMKGMKPSTVHYIVFHPNQVKSAVGNSGKFSTTNNNIISQNDQDKSKTRVV